jgi:hypothetical protein
MDVIAMSANASHAKMQTSLTLTTNKFNSNGYWSRPIDKMLYIPIADDLSLFDQNGYDLTVLEQRYANSNHQPGDEHRYRVAVKQPWFTQEQGVIEGAILNHSLLFERKAYTGAALDQLTYWAKSLPIVHKVIAMRPKWGLDFSMDYVDRVGNAFEVLHWEYDGFDYQEIQSIKEMIEPVLLDIDWNDAAKTLLHKKSQWHHLDFFEQSAWKCDFFGIKNERFKMVLWE